MTREEAIEIMQINRDGVANMSWSEDRTKTLAAFDMAIKALSQQTEDAISRTWLKKAFHNYFQGLVHVVTEEDVQAYIDVAPNVTPKQRWIPVSERLPDERKSVLVWCPEYRNMYCAYLENKSWWIFGAFSQIIPNAVIAWMPLPELYKAESEEA